MNQIHLKQQISQVNTNQRMVHHEVTTVRALASWTVFQNYEHST